MLRSLVVVAALTAIFNASTPSSSVATSAVAGAAARHPVAGGDLALRSVSAGHFNSCALTEQGDVACWGRNIYGSLGIGGTDIDGMRWPIPVGQLNGPAVDVAVGVTHVCAMMSLGGVRCWGSNQHGELGNGTVGLETGVESNPVPGDVVQLRRPVLDLAVGYRINCALTGDGDVWCWGGIGGNRSAVPVPQKVGALTPGIKQFAGNFLHMCAVSVVGAAYCWGSNWFGQLGDGTTEESWTAVPVAGLQGGVSAITASLGHSCALRDDGRALCWGDNQFGQLGDGTVQQRLNPVEVQGLGGTVKSIAAGGAQTCALLTSGELKCWGRNDVGQLGLGFTDGLQHPLPTLVPGLAGPVVSVAMSIGGHPNFDPLGLDVGDDGSADWLGHTCVVLDHGRVQCWGANSYGQLGDGSFTRRPSPGDLFNPVVSLLLPALMRP